MPVLEPGDNLRIASSVYTGGAVYLESWRDTLKIFVNPRKQTVSIPFDSLTRLERYCRVPWTSRALEGAMWGAIGGAGVGTLGIFLSERGPGDPPQAWWPLVGVAYFTVPTAVIFAVVPVHEWEPVPLPNRTRMRARPVPNGLTVRLTW